jgi:hypothetical protein
MSDMEKPAEAAAQAAAPAPSADPQAAAAAPGMAEHDPAAPAFPAEPAFPAAPADPAAFTAPAFPAAPIAPAPSVTGTPLGVKVTAAVAAAVLAGVGIGFGIIKAGYDDTAKTASPARSVPSASPSAASTPAYGALSSGAHFGSMRDLLLPEPSGFSLGPDAGLYGDDTQLTKDQISAYLDDRVSVLPKDQRDKAKAALQADGHRGAGVRSYVPSDDSMVATIWLDQFDKQAVAEESAFQAALGADSGLFRQGPAVPGHAEAACYLPALQPKDPIDGMVCTAGIGDLLVTMDVEGLAPLPKSEAVSLFRQQLERLALPGASV